MKVCNRFDHVEGCDCPLTQVAIFWRMMEGKEFFYPIEGREFEPWARHAELNPGTLRIESIGGDILWQPETVQ